MNMKTMNLMMVIVKRLIGMMVIKNAKIKEELMPIAWHPLRWWDWCVPEDEKKETEKLWA